jgi:hypothetical protein
LSQGLLHEEKQARLAISDCDAELDEMDLIEIAKTDAAQLDISEDAKRL